MNQKYRIDLSYNGSTFHGWQSQPDGSGVQDSLEKALSTFLRHEVRVVGSSRTDSGVHAEQQVACFQTSEDFDSFKWCASLKGLLPKSVGVIGITPVEPEFHPIESSVGKVYRYRIWRDRSVNPFLAPFSWHFYGIADSHVEDLRVLAGAFCGSHDFRSFCASDSGAKTFVRTITGVEVCCQGPLIEIWFAGTGFLKQMIRNIVGTMVDTTQGKLNLTVTELLAAKDRTQSGITAPAAGLSLVRVFYEGEPQIAPLFGH